ncbi:MAG TPA: hypothetical protein VK811_08200 [Candidatus Acidoferrum sp.]|nr:hypothetical protein [Candidatus Acidoferrum sp.]
MIAKETAGKTSPDSGVRPTLQESVVCLGRRRYLAQARASSKET